MTQAFLTNTNFEIVTMLDLSHVSDCEPQPPDPDPPGLPSGLNKTAQDLPDEEDPPGPEEDTEEETESEIRFEVTEKLVKTGSKVLC